MTSFLCLRFFKMKSGFYLGYILYTYKRFVRPRLAYDEFYVIKFSTDFQISNDSPFFMTLEIYFNATFGKSRFSRVETSYEKPK